jgi:hypothetical protein
MRSKYCGISYEGEKILFWKRWEGEYGFRTNKKTHVYIYQILHTLPYFER